MARQSYLPNIQILRFVAALMVLFAHLLRATVDQKIPQMQAVTDGSGIEWGTGIDVFFIVSGFIMYYLTSTHFGSKGYAGEFIKRRVLRVVPLYWLFTALMLFSIWQFRAIVHHTDASLSTVFGSLLFYPVTRIDGRIKPILLLGWTLEYEMFFYACFALALLYRKRVALGGLFAVFITLALLHRYVPVTATALRFWSDPIILEFLLGIVLADLYLRQLRLSWFWQGALIVAAFAMMSLLGHSPYVGEWIWGGLPAFVLVAALALGPEWSVRPLAIGGLVRVEGHLVDVLARAEVLARPGEHDHLDVVVVFGLRQLVHELPVHIRRQDCVAPVRPVEGQPPHVRVRLVVQDQLAWYITLCPGTLRGRLAHRVLLAHRVTIALRRTSRKGVSRSRVGSFGMPSSRSLIMFRCISLDPPATQLAWRDRYCNE